MTNSARQSTQRWLAFRNDASESVPPYGAMRVTGSVTDDDGSILLTMDVPDDSDGQSICFNGRTTVPSDEYGSCTFDVPCYANLATAGSNGDRFDIVEDEFQLNSDGAGAYTVLAIASDGPNGETVGLIDKPGSAGQSTGLVCVYNDSEQTVPRFGVLAIDGPYYDPTDPDEFDDFARMPPAVRGVFPDPEEPRHVGCFCIAQEEIPENEWGIGLVSGITPVQVWVEQDATVTHADITDAVDRLESDPDRLAGSALVLWKSDWDGVDELVWALVRISNPTEPPPGCGEKPLLDNFDDDSGVTLDNHFMDKGCGWLPRVGSLTEYVINSNQCEASTGANSGAYTIAKTATSTVVLNCTMGTATDLSISVIVRLKSTSTFWFAELRAQGGSSSTFKLIEKTNGTNTTRVSNTGLTVPFATNYVITLSDSGSGLLMSVSGGVSSSGSYASTLHTTGQGVGFGTINNSGSYSGATIITKFQCT